MFLVTAATEFEMKPFRSSCRLDGVPQLVTGIGPVEAALSLYAWLSRHDGTVRGVISFGAGGSYFQAGKEETPQLLDICLAEHEVLGDLGICLADRVERFTGRELRVPDTFSLDPQLLADAKRFLASRRIPFHSGTFVTVSCASGTEKRGKLLASQYHGLCENMEGAAVARVCREFALPCLELRCISNMVENRDTSRWQLQKACRKAGETTALLVEHLYGATAAGPGSEE